MIEGAEVVFEVKLRLPFQPEEGAHLVEVQAPVFVMMQPQEEREKGSILINESQKVFEGKVVCENVSTNVLAGKI